MSTVVLPERHRGQLRMAERLVRAQRSQLRHCHGIGWHTWDGHRWAYDEDGAATRAAVQTVKDAYRDLADLSEQDRKDLLADIRKVESNAGIDGTLRLAGDLKPLAISPSVLDQDGYLLNTAAGTLDLNTMQLREPQPDDHLTKLTRGAYTPGATAAAWERFLERILPDLEVRQYVQRIVGLALVGQVIEHILPILVGEGANGKSVLAAAISWALGDYAIHAEPDLLMHRDGAHPTGEMDLRGARWAVVSETERDRRLAEATVKRLTGGDTITARRMRRDFVRFEPSHTFALITNHLPRASADDPALWRRIRVIPFDVTIPKAEQDGQLQRRLRDEADGILTWAVDGYVDYAKRGLAEPQAVLGATQRYRGQSEPVAKFITECCVTGPDVAATTDELYDHWKAWAAAEVGGAGSQKALGQALDRCGYPTTKDGAGRRLRRGLRPRDGAQ